MMYTMLNNIISHITEKETVVILIKPIKSII